MLNAVFTACHRLDEGVDRLASWNRDYGTMAGIAAMCMGYVFSQFFRAFLAVLTPVLQRDLSMTPTELAYASGAWFIAFAAMQFPVGTLLDTIGPRRTAGIIFTIFAGSGIFLFAYASSPLAIIVAMALIGIGCSPVLMAPFYIFAREFSPAQLATLVSTFIAVGTLGNIAGSEPLAAAVDAFGWRTSAMGLGVGTVVVGIAILLLARDPAKLDAAGAKGSYLELLKIRALWPIFPVILMGYTVAAGLRGLWIGPYHADVFGYNTLEIGRVTLYMSIALALGTLCFGPLDRIFNSRKRVVMGGNFVVLALCVYMAFAPSVSALTGTLVFVAIGFFGSSYAVQMTHGRAFLPAHMTGRGATLLNFCSIGGAGLFQWVSGPVVEMSVDPANPESQYQALFIFYSVLMVIAVVAYAFSRDVKPRDVAL